MVISTQRSFWLSIWGFTLLWSISLLSHAPSCSCTSFVVVAFIFSLLYTFHHIRIAEWDLAYAESIWLVLSVCSMLVSQDATSVFRKWMPSRCVRCHMGGYNYSLLTHTLSTNKRCSYQELDQANRVWSGTQFSLPFHLSDPSWVTRIFPACLYTSLPGGLSLLVPACCFMWYCMTDLMTCVTQLPIWLLRSLPGCWSFFFFFLLWLSFYAPLGFGLANHSALSVRYMKRERPPAAGSALCPPLFHRNAPVPLSSELTVTATVARPACHACGALQKERCFILYLAGTQLNWTVRPRQYDTICFLPCSGPRAGCWGISCYLSTLELVKWTIQETPLPTLSSVAQFVPARLQNWIVSHIDAKVKMKNKKWRKRKCLPAYII